MRRYKQQEFSFESFHVKLMYVDRLFVFIINSYYRGGGGGGAYLFHARLRGRLIKQEGL